ncbi:phosphate/phosphite/phosphonate ABC transporter substrate-binding protein [Neoroseomonas marina]|nr:PhnD/SsuA/transferrin family substrate-binding protein [Neoroseomonas marina]
MKRSASLPMYNLAGLRPANAAFWAAVAEALRARGIGELPEAPDFERPAVPDRIGPEVLFTQTCGFPLGTIYRGQHALLGVPDYEQPGDARAQAAAMGIAGPVHCAFILVRDDDPARSLEDLRGRVFACNSQHSNSGMNLPRRTLAPLAGGRPFFARVVETGTHPASMALVQSGGADAASIDNMTYSFHADVRPEAVAGLRVLAETVPSPAIPFVTSAATDTATQSALREALHEVSVAPRHAALRHTLRLRAIVPPEGSDYAILARYEAEAAAMGYPRLV